MDRKSLGKTAYKALAVGLLLYGLVYGLTRTLPALPGLGQSARNMFFHIPMWFVVISLMGISLYHSIRFLRLSDPENGSGENPLLSDAKAYSAAHLGTLFICLGLVTGSIWGRVAWKAHQSAWQFSTWWTNDPILIAALVSLLIYLAYFLLRSSFSEPESRARVAAVYSIFAFAALIPLYFIVPKLLPGLHPTSGDSDAGGGSFIFKQEGFDNSYRAIMYPVMLGFILLGVWIYNLRSRLEMAFTRLEDIQAEREYEQSIEKNPEL